MSEQTPPDAPPAYTLDVDDATNTIRVSGTLRLNGVAAYQPITDTLMENALSWPQCVLDLSGLAFLNSSGIAMLSRFVIDMRNREDASLTIIGSKSVVWQGKSLRNLQRLMPSLVLELK